MTDPTPRRILTPGQPCTCRDRDPKVIRRNADCELCAYDGLTLNRWRGYLAPAGATRADQLEARAGLWCGCLLERKEVSRRGWDGHFGRPDDRLQGTGLLARGDCKRCSSTGIVRVPSASLPVPLVFVEELQTDTYRELGRPEREAIERRRPAPQRPRSFLSPADLVGIFSGSALDNVAAMVQVQRQQGETDEQLRARLAQSRDLPTLAFDDSQTREEGLRAWLGERTITPGSSAERSFRFTGDRAYDLHRLEQEIEETFKHLPAQRPAGFPSSRELAEEVMRAREKGTTANPEWVSFLDNLRPLGVADFQRAKQRLREAIGADAAMSGTVAGDEVKAGQMVKVDDQGKVRAANPLPVGSSLASMLVHQSIRERWMREDAERFGMGGLFSERFLTKPAPEPKPNQQLDNIAKVHGLTRYAGESDDDLRTRVIRHAERRGVPLDLPIKVTGKVSVGVDRGAGDRSELAVCMMSAGRVERMYTGDQARRFLAHIEAFDKPKLWTELDPQRLRVEQAHVMREAADQVERRQKFYTEGSYARAALGTAAEVLADIARQVQRGTPLAEVGTPPPRGGERAEPAPPIAYPTLNPPRSQGERLSLEQVRELATRLWQERNPAGRVIVDFVSRTRKGGPLCYTDGRKAVLLRVELGTWSDETVFAEGPSAEDIEQNIEAAWREVSGEIARGWKP
jgi:Arc/MetJ family transcription regulator